MIDLIMPTLGKPHLLKALASLRYLPFPVKPHIISRGASWPEAINLGLDESIGDVLLMDDDVELLPDTFKGFDPEAADVVGFKLLFPDETIQHAGVFVHLHGVGHIGFKQPASEFNYSQRVCAVTASLMYIHREVIDEIGQITQWDGYQFEDTDFCFRAFKAGFTLVTTPATAIHHESQTKKLLPDFEAKLQTNMKKLADTHFKNELFLHNLMSYPRPIKEPRAASN
jgi:GT2 family glycosyltransferase